MGSRAGPSRAASPTYTTFSGISNYRTNTPSYRGPGNPPPAPASGDPRAIARTHFEELSKYLAEYLAREQPNSRSTARQKLTRLTRQQFQELSTDVYDELLRRKGNSAESTVVPFLPVRDDFHPKRNQARQKLATLPTSRFQDLSSDVYYELTRRYPEFKEETYPSSPGSNYDDGPASADVVSPRQQPAPLSTAPLVPRGGPGRASQDRGITPLDPPYTPASGRPAESPYSPEGRRSGTPYESQVGRRPSDGRSAGYRSTRQSEDPYGGVDEDDARARSSVASASARRKPSVEQMPGYRQPSVADRRRPSEDMNARRTSERERERERAHPARRPSEDQGGWRDRDGSDGAASTYGAGAQATATRGEVVPMKSTITEEDFEIPFATNGARDSGETLGGEDDEGRGQRSAAVDESEYEDEMSPRVGGLSGLAGLSQRLGGSSPSSPEDARPEPDYRAAGGARTSAGAESVKREYEARLAEMQRQMDDMARNADDAAGRADALRASEARVRQLEDDLALVRQRAEEQGGAMRALQRELEDVQAAKEREQVQAERLAEEDARTVRDLTARVQRAEQENEMAQSFGGVNRETVEQVQADMQGLMFELTELMARNDELLAAKDHDVAVIRELTTQVKDYKRKYEQAKTELRSLKVTSQLFLQAPKSDDQLPVAPDGGILDIHMTAFISSADALLTAGRSSAVTQVLTPMKSVVDAVSAILDDLRTHTAQPGDRSPLDADASRTLHERAEATLANLVAAASTHATSAGMAPVSLLDAAASHVSAAVTDIARTVLVRRASRGEMDRFAPVTPPAAATVAANGFNPALERVRESREQHSRADSGASMKGIRSPPVRNARPPSDPPSSNGSASPPPIFDQTTGGGTSDVSTAEGGDDGWIELKPYLEAQSESVVFAIQAVLSGVRSAAPPPSLGENVTQIITIVSSIVAVCKDNLPAGASAGPGGPTGQDIVRELSDHANRLSEALDGELTKEARQTMAKSSFAVANAMKALAKL